MKKLLGTTEVKAGEHTISLKAPFKRVNMVDAVNEKTGKDFRNITLEEAEDAIAKITGIANSYSQFSLN